MFSVEEKFLKRKVLCQAWASAGVDVENIECQIFIRFYYMCV